MSEAAQRSSSFPAQKLAPFAIVGIVAACNAVAWNGERAGTVGFALWSMLPSILLAALGALWLRREDGDLQLLSPRWGDASLAIVCALSLFGGAWLLVHVLAPQGTPREAWMARLYLQFGPGGDLKKQMVVVVVALIAIAIGEEVLWRGVVTRLLEPMVGSRRAWIASAFLYALAHLPTVFLLADERAGKNPMLVLGALGAGLVWGGLARKLGRLTPGILAHVAFDWTVLVLFRLWGPESLKRHGTLEALGRKLGVAPTWADGAAPEARRHALAFATAYPALGRWLDAAPELWRALSETRVTTSKDQRAHERAFARHDVHAALGPRLAGYVRQELLRVAYRELFAPGNPVSDTARELSDLADFSVSLATDEALAWARERFGAVADVRFVVLGMGKLGGRELNAGSDIDLVFFHDDADDPDGTVADVLGRVGARIVATLETTTAAGAAYRVDMRLRPEGKSGPLVHSLSRAERYYETWGRTWERVAFLRARPIAGSLAFGQEMLNMLAPFVWRRSVDPELPREVGRLLEQARAQRGARAAKRDLKIGPGGIREVEFFAQSLCLVWGGREPALRVRHTLEQLRKLRAKGYVTDREARDLLDAYVILRSVEHRVQFATWEQTHDLPPPGPLLDRIAASFGVTQTSEFEARLERIRRRVSEHFRRLSSVRTSRSGPGELDLGRIWSAIDDGDADALPTVLAQRGLEGFEELADQVRGLARRPDFPLGKLTRERYPRFVEAFAGALFDAADPEMAARLIGQFFARLETPSVYVKLFEDEPRALLRFVSLTGGSSELGERLVGHPELVDNIVFATAEDPSAPLPHAGSLERALEIEMERAVTDYGEGLEAVVAASRRLKSETTVRVGVRDLGGEASPEGIASALTDLADVQVRAALVAASGSAARDATAGDATQGLAAMAMGKYGGRELSYGSDLDLFFIFDPAAFAEEDAPYRIATRILRLLSTTHAEGPGYELDTRLRPSGNQGLLVTSENAFARYHGEESGVLAKAEAWERQALIKARFVAGDAALGARTAALAGRIAYASGAPDPARVLELRLRMQGEAKSAAAYDIKLGPGGLVDIEFLVQTLQMRHGADARVHARSTEAALRALAQVGALAEDTAATLLRHYAFYRRLEQRLRIVYGRSDTLVVREGPQLRTLARRLGFFGDARRPEEGFVETLLQTMDEVRAIFLAAMTARW